MKFGARKAIAAGTMKVNKEGKKCIRYNGKWYRVYKSKTGAKYINQGVENGKRKKVYMSAYVSDSPVVRKNSKRYKSVSPGGTTARYREIHTSPKGTQYVRRKSPKSKKNYKSILARLSGGILKRGAWTPMGKLF